MLAAGMRELSLDTNTFIDLLDPRTFDAGRVASELRRLGIHLVVPEIVVAQTFIHPDREKMYARFRRMVELALAARWPMFSFGAPLYRIRNEELSGREIPSSPLDTKQMAQVFGGVSSFSDFTSWHETLREECKDFLDTQGWLARDHQARRIAGAEIVGALSEREKADHLREWLQRIPASLTADHWMIEALIEDQGDRIRIANNPREFPSVVAFLLMSSVNAVGAAVDLRGHHEFDYLRIGTDSWTDARIVAASVYADVFATSDARLQKRARLLASWGFFEPQICSWREVFA